MRLHLAYGERNPQLRIVASGVFYNVKVRGQQLIEPLFNDRFPVAARHTDNRNRELTAEAG